MLNLAGFAYLSVIGALVAYAVWFRGIQRLPAMVVSFLGEALSGWQLVGAVLGLAAVSLVQRPRIQAIDWARRALLRKGLVHGLVDIGI